MADVEAVSDTAALDDMAVLSEVSEMPALPDKPLMSPPPALPEQPPPAPNPDAQTTVNDFLDYTDFFPSDLVRSLTLIGDLDATAADAVQHVHDLAALYCQLPRLHPRDRLDPSALRRHMARHLHTAIRQREYAYTEAARLYEVALRHRQRSSIITRKLRAQPEPPSRDPTPPPVSPSALKRSYERPRLHLPFDSARPRASSLSASSSSSSSSPDHNRVRRIHHTHRPARPRPRPRNPHTYKDRLHKPRSRPPGVAGTNVHSAIAGISTSNALAKLTPPPADARPGSKWAPWMKLTEYEMAVLRKQMKKNAVWTPSLTMVNRELERKHRTRRDYDREKQRCHAAGETLLDEEPETLLQIATAQGVDDALVPTTTGAADSLQPPADAASTPTHERGERQERQESLEAADAADAPTALDTRRKKARGALRALQDATKTIQNAADGLKELTFSAHSVTTPPTSAQRRSSLARPATNKRKRDTTPPSPAEQGTAEPGHESESEPEPETEPEPEPEPEPELEPADKDTPSQQPEPKRPRLQLIAPAPPRGSTSSMPRGPTRSITQNHTPSVPVVHTPSTPPARTSSPPAPASAAPSVSRDPPAPAAPSPSPELPETATSTVQVPLAPAGPSTPNASEQLTKDAVPAATSKSPPVVSTLAPEPPPPQPAPTTVSTRSQRKSITPKNSSPPPAEPSRPTRSTVSALDAITSPEATVALRPRSSRSHVPTPKAQSEEPKPNEGRTLRDGRRHSIFSQPALTAPAPTRVSARRKPPPKGEVTSAENGQKTVTNVKRSQGNKNIKRKKNEGQPEQVEQVDSDEERYCICDDVSYGQMISCDNNCDKEWFHFECVGMTQMPARRAKWYCPDCREKLGTDAFGNPKVPPSLPGRSRNNR